jgi:hypothetical protein
VIVDESGRYVHTQLNETTLWRYDRRWRKVSMCQPYGDKAFTTIDGKHHFAVVHQAEPGGEVEVTLRSAADPEAVLATGRFVDTWIFEGEPKLWGRVPEYIITKQKDGNSALLRIEDDAEVDPLEGFESAHTVVAVPNSRLVVVGGAGSYTVYDPVAMRAIRHYQLAGGNQLPFMRFRNDEELWLNDVDTMLKIETKQFEVIDAAGSDIGETEGPSEGQTEGPSEGPIEGPKELGGFGRWTFAAGNELCVVTRPNVGDVLVLDAVSMLPVARGVLSRGLPLEAVLIGRNTIVATDVEGKPLRTRLRRVTINFEGPQSDSSGEDTPTS